MSVRLSRKPLKTGQLVEPLTHSWHYQRRLFNLPRASVDAHGEEESTDDAQTIGQLSPFAASFPLNGHVAASFSTEPTEPTLFFESASLQTSFPTTVGYVRRINFKNKNKIIT